MFRADSKRTQEGHCRSDSMYCVSSPAIIVPALAFGQEPAKQMPKMGSKEWTELEKTLWDVDQQWLCSAGATPYHKGLQRVRRISATNFGP